MMMLLKQLKPLLAKKMQLIIALKLIWWQSSFPCYSRDDMTIGTQYICLQKHTVFKWLNVSKPPSEFLITAHWMISDRKWQTAPTKRRVGGLSWKLLLVIKFNLMMESTYYGLS